MVPFQAKTQLQLSDELAARLRDPTNVRWTAVEKYNAINHAVQMWGNRVLIPFIYTPSDWVYNTRQYTLPSYVHEPIQVFWKSNATSPIWKEFVAFDVGVEAGAGTNLTFEFYPYPSQARVVWWGRNSQVPTTVPTISGSSITDTSTSVTVGAAVDCSDSGFVKIEAEWIQYAGVTRAAATTTLTNLIRGCFGTTAASHNTAVSVYWGVAVHMQSLFEQLMAEAMAYLHQLYLNLAAVTEKETYQWNMRYWKQQADDFWMTYVPAYSPKMVPSLRGFGEPLDDTYPSLWSTYPDYPYFP